MSDSIRKRLLIVEDSPDYRHLLRKLFTREGYEVTLAVHGQDALDQLRADDHPRPNLILLDLMMPVMDGFEFRELQVKDQRLASIPVILMTAHGDLRNDPQRLGIRTCVRKPVDMNVLLSLVRAHCESN